MKRFLLKDTGIIGPAKLPFSFGVPPLRPIFGFLSCKTPTWTRGSGVESLFSLSGCRGVWWCACLFGSWLVEGCLMCWWGGRVPPASMGLLPRGGPPPSGGGPPRRHGRLVCVSLSIFAALPPACRRLTRPLMPFVCLPHSNCQALRQSGPRSLSPVSGSMVFSPDFPPLRPGTQVSVLRNPRRIGGGSTLSPGPSCADVGRGGSCRFQCFSRPFCGTTVFAGDSSSWSSVVRVPPALRSPYLALLLFVWLVCIVGLPVGLMASRKFCRFLGWGASGV